MSGLWTPLQARIGLRFKRGQAKTLDRLADHFEVDGHHEHVTLFRQAAIHARSGEPLIIEAESIEEARDLASAFTRYPGVIAPELVQLTA